MRGQESDEETPYKPRNVQGTRIVHANTDGKVRPSNISEKMRNAPEEFYNTDTPFRPFGNKPRPNELSHIAKTVDTYSYADPHSATIQPVKGRHFDTQSEKQGRTTRLPLLEAMGKPNSVDTPASNINNYQKPPGYRPTNRIQEHEGSDVDTSRKVQDPNEYSSFIPYSYNLQDQNKISDGVQTKAARSTSVPVRRERSMQPSIATDVRAIEQGNRIIKPEPPQKRDNPHLRGSNLRPLASAAKQSLNTSFNNSFDTQAENPSTEINSRTIDYSILKREAELLPSAKVINSRRVADSYQPAGLIEPHSADKAMYGLEAKSLTNQSSLLTTPRKVTKPVFQSFVKDEFEQAQDHVAFKRPDPQLRTSTGANPLIKKNAVTPIKAQTRISDKNPSYYEALGNQRPPAFKDILDRKSNPPSPKAIQHQSSHKFESKGNRTDFTNDFRREPSTYELDRTVTRPGATNPNDIGSNPTENPPLASTNYPTREFRADDTTPKEYFTDFRGSFGDNQGLISSFKNPPQSTITNERFEEPSHKKSSDNAFNQTFYPDKNKVPQGREQIIGTSLANKIEINSSILEYLKSNTKCNLVACSYLIFD